MKKNLELTTDHPKISIDELLEQAQEVRVGASPHVGNLDQQSNPHYLALAMGGVTLRLVDTITMDDRHGRPALAVCDDKEELIFESSRKQSRRITPAAAMLEDNETTAEEFHLESLDTIGAEAKTATKAFEHIGVRHGLGEGEVLGALMIACDQPVRQFINGEVSRDPRKLVHSSGYEQHGLFGAGRDKLNGLALPLPGMMAAEVVEATVDSRDYVYHVGGEDMSNYTKDAEVMSRVTEIADRAMAELGLNGICRKMSYVVYDKNSKISGIEELSREVSDRIGIKNFSQHDLAKRQSLV